MRAQYTIISEWVTGLDGGPASEGSGWCPSDEEGATYAAEYTERRQSQETLDAHEFKYGVQHALLQLRLLDDFILTSIYGLLGAIAFMLRQISVELQSQSLSPGTY
ncbi:MAG: hypothetical protein R8G34_14020 [Paracoccaceae bacterium]|nr:hypothetical protein [Paracoccaceae bacterium]